MSGTAAVLLLGLAVIAFWPEGGVKPVADPGPHATRAIADASGSSTSAPLSPQDGMASAPLWRGTDNSGKEPTTAAAAPSSSVIDSQSMQSGRMTPSVDAGPAPSTAAPVVQETSAQRPAMSLDELERLAEKAFTDRDEQEITRLRELLKQHPPAVPRVVRLGERLSSSLDSPRDPNGIIGRRLAIQGIARLDSGDEFGAYLLARSARPEWQASSPWWRSDAVMTLVAKGPAKFPLQDLGTYDALRGGGTTVSDEMLKESLEENVFNEMPRGVVRVFCENESVESRLFVEGERGCVVIRGHSYSGSGQIQSGQLVVVSHTSPKGKPRIRISGLRHYPAVIEPNFSKAGVYWGAVVLHELPSTQVGKLQVRLEPEPGLIAAELSGQLQLRLGPHRYCMIPLSDWSVLPDSWVGSVLQVAPVNYSFQVHCSQAATPIQQQVEVEAGELREVTIPLFRRRQVTFDWKYRPNPDADIVEGTTTVMTGASVRMRDWEGFARNVYLLVDEWDGRGSRLTVNNAAARTVSSGTWNSSTWLSAKENKSTYDISIEVGTTILLGNSISGSEAFKALIRVREMKVPE